MQPHLTNLEFILGGFAFIVVAIFALTAYLENRKRNTPTFLNYYCTEFDQDEFLQSPRQRDSFAGPNEWRDRTQPRLQTSEAGMDTPQSGELE